jgi:hypothetical protein
VTVKSPDAALPSNAIVSSIAEVLEKPAALVSCAVEGTACAVEDAVVPTKLEVLQEEEVAN